MSFKLKYSSKGDIGVISLSNPPYNNLTHPVFEDLSTLTDFLATPEFKAILVEGQGRHFCAGADLNKLREQVKSEEDFGALLNRGKALLEAISLSTIPVVAVVKGSCLGAGLEIALSCHFRCASRHAMLGFPEADLGLMPGFGGTISAREAAGRGAALELILTGRMIRGEEAAELGIIDEVSPPGEVENKAVDFIRSLTEGRSTRLIRAVLTSIHNYGRMPREKALTEETLLFCKLAQKAGIEENNNSNNE